MKAEWLKPFHFKPGQIGNPKGRPKTKTLKEHARDYLASLSDKERAQFFNGLNKAEVWRMAEGNPANDLNIDGEVRLPMYLPSELLPKNDIPQINDALQAPQTNDNEGNDV